MTLNKQTSKLPIYNVTWSAYKHQSIVVMRNWMLLITLVSVVAIFMMTLASYYFVPMQSVTPFVIQIDEKTGVTEVIDSKAVNQYSANEMLIRHFANKYIQPRETYSYTNYTSNIDTVRLMSTQDVFRLF